MLSCKGTKIASEIAKAKIQCLTIMSTVNAEKIVRSRENGSHENLPMVRFFTDLKIISFLETDKCQNQISFPLKVNIPNDTIATSSSSMEH